MSARRPSFENRFTPQSAWMLGGSAIGTDRSGNGYNLTPTGTPAPSPSYVRDQKASLLGTFSLVSTNANLNITGAVTTEVVCLSPGGTSLLSWGATGETLATNYTWQLIASAAGMGVFWEFGAGVDVLGTGMGRLPNNRWLHLAWTRTLGGTALLYANGVLLGTVVGTPAAGGTSGSYAIGGALNASTSWTGLYAANYTTVLSQREIGYLARLRGVDT